MTTGAPTMTVAATAALMAHCEAVSAPCCYGRCSALEHRIRAHVLICRLALMLVRVAERGTGHTWAMRKAGFRSPSHRL